MATRSTITVKCTDGIIRSVYCHFDGYLEGVGTKLLASYNTQALADCLICKGDLRSITDGMVSFSDYSGGDEEPCSVLSSVKKVEKEDFNYYWNGSKWLELDNPEWNVAEVTADNLPDALALIDKLKAELAKLKGL